MGLRQLCFSPFLFKADMADKPVKAFLTKLDELNVIMLESYYSEDRKQRAKKVEDDLFDLLVEAYLLGIDHVTDSTGRVILVDSEKMEQAVYRKIDKKDFMDRVEEHVREENVTALQTLAETEYHRVFNEATADGAADYTRETGKPLSKTWRTMRDNRVRETHEGLEGQRIPFDSWFFANDGDQALFPGGFANPENNVNCRCWLDIERVNA